MNMKKGNEVGLWQSLILNAITDIPIVFAGHNVAKVVEGHVSFRLEF